MTDLATPDSPTVRFPRNSRVMIGLRFLNILDPDTNILSPVRVQAWIATLQAAGAVIGQSNEWVTGSSIVWATLAHIIHLSDKSNRAKNAAALQAAGKS